MATKKGRKQSHRSKGNKATGGKKGANAKVKKGAAARKQVAGMVGKKGAARGTRKHVGLRIGLSNKTSVPVFRTGRRNTFRVFGDRIGIGNPNNKPIHLDATDHTWIDPPPADVQNVGRDALQITAVCN